MTLPELRLDDLTWNDLVATGRSAIPAASEGRWTLHAPVDPGVTLLEVFAAQLEQRLFTLDQVPDTLVWAVMGLLLGAAAGPRPASAAVTVLMLDGDRPGLLPAGSEFTQVFDGVRMTLSTEQSAPVVPGARVEGVRVDGAAQFFRLDGEPVPLLGVTGHGTAEFSITADRPAAHHQLYLAILPPPVASWVRGEPAPLPPGSAGVARAGLGWIGDDGTQGYLDGRGQPAAAISPSDPAQVHLGALVNRCPAQDGELRWELLDGAGVWPVIVEDGTGGLRVPGVVGLQLEPPRLFPEAFRLRVSRASGVSAVGGPRAGSGPPVWVTGAAMNAVVARHWRGFSAQRIELTDHQPRPGREIVLDDASPRSGQPLDALIDDPDLVRVTAQLPDGSEEIWTAVGDLAFSGPDDRHFIADRLTGRLRFGDGSAGRIPRWPAAATVAADYRVGGGEPPRIGLGEMFAGPMSGPAAVRGRTFTALQWGSEPEDMLQARARAAEELARSTRMVTAQDVEAIIAAVPGVPVAAVRVSPGVDPEHPGIYVPDAVCVTVVPKVLRRSLNDLRALAAPELDPVSRRAISAALGRARLIGSQISVRGPVYRGVSVRIELVVHAADVPAVRQQAELVTRQFLDPLVGGAAGTGWEFGSALAPWDAGTVLMRSLGRRASVVRVELTVDGAAPTDCDAVPLGRDELPAVTGVTVVPVAGTLNPIGAGSRTVTN